MVSAAIAYGLLSPVIAARRLYFLASASPHSALLAAVIAIPIARTIGFGNEYLWAVFIGALLIYIVGYMIHRGIDTDIATALFVAFTASSSVLAIYYILTRFPVKTNIWAIIVGDPLLVDWNDTYYAIIIAIVISASIILTYREQICMGIDYECSRLAGIRRQLYDWLVFTLLAIATVALIRIVGFVLEHVLILLPSAIAITIARNAFKAIVTSLLTSLFSSIMGLYLAITLDLSPAGVTGLVLLSIYVFGILIKKRWYK